MTQVGPASDIWSVGCLIIEMLTGSPPYYELQPMSALFRIVQDECPPLPEGISPLMQVSSTHSTQLGELRLVRATSCSSPYATSRNKQGSMGNEQRLRRLGRAACVVCKRD